MTVRVELRKDSGRLRSQDGPWIRKHQIARIHGAAMPGDVVGVVDRTGEIVAWGLLSPDSRITVRVLSFGSETLAPDWLERRIDRALTARRAYAFARDGTTGYREINSEGDGLPGLVVDRYDRDRVIQVTTAPMVALLERIRARLVDETAGTVAVVVPQAKAAREGIAPGVETGASELHFSEHGLRFVVPGPPAQKTGAFFDQRDNHREVARLAAAHGGALLDVGCHVGGFAIAAAREGVPAVGLDSSATALAYARRNAASNATNVTWIEGDMFRDELHDLNTRRFGTIVIDPPKMASKRGDIDRASRALHTLVARFLPHLEWWGHLVLCSCSHHLGSDRLDAAVNGHGRFVHRVKVLGAGFDHPIWPHHREGEYLRVHVYQCR